MDTSDIESVITVKIDSDLARRYREAYLAAFGIGQLDDLSIEDFIARFVQDRLIEETEFIAVEASTQAE